jgi:four helix bundle protein
MRRDYEIENDVEMMNKVVRLIAAVNEISDKLPENDIHQLKKRLRLCISEMPTRIEESWFKTRKIDKIRCFIKVSGSIEECRDYLCFIELLRYCRTRELIRQCDEINRMIVRENIPYTSVN